MPQPQLTDPDQWLAAQQGAPQGGAKPLTDPDTWIARMQPSDEDAAHLGLPGGGVYTGFQGPPQQPKRFKPEAVPVPQQGVIGSTVAAIPDAWAWTKDNLLSPEALATTAAGTATAARGTIPGMIASGAAGGAVAAGREMYRRAADPVAMQEPITTSIAPIAEGAVAGAGGELVARGLMGFPLRRSMTPEGNAATNFFGRKNTMAQQMVNSAPLDFAANVAKYGPGGKKVIDEFEGRQSQAVLDRLDQLSHELNNNSGISIDPATGEFNRGMAGKRTQIDLRDNLDAARKNSGYPQFLQTYGQSAEDITDPLTGEITKGTPVSKLHSQRSAALDMSRDAFKAGDVKSQAQALGTAKKLSGRIEKALPDQAARDEYQQIGTQYAAEMERLNNPTVETVRTGRSDDVVDTVINNKLKNYDTMKDKVGQTNAELLGRMQKALSPAAWNQLQADTVHRLGERAVDPNTGMISASSFQDMINSLDGPTQQRLFGKTMGDIHTTLTAMSQAQQYTKSQAGRLFIAIRSGSAGIQLSKALGATALGAAGAGYETGHPVYGAAGAATILLSPYVFAKLLTSEVGRTLLTKAAANPTSTARSQIIKGLTRFAAQNAASEPLQPNDSSDTDTSIPAPPTAP